MKIIQITSLEDELVALCEDGSLWVLKPDELIWRRLKGIRTENELFNELQNKPIESLGFSGRVIRVLRAVGINKVGALLALSVEDLRNINRLGKKSLYEIESKLAALDLNS